MRHIGTSLLILALAVSLGCGRKTDLEGETRAAAGNSRGDTGNASLSEESEEGKAGESATEAETPSPSEESSGEEKATSEESDSEPTLGKEEEAVPKKEKKFPEIKNPVVAIEGEKGTIYIELFKDQAPKHTENFLQLTRQKFYDGTRWHRRDEGFVIQGGDPLSKKPDWRKQRLGTGGVEYTIEGEFEVRHDRGTVAMARQGDAVNPQRRSSGCQFYICLGPAHFLDGAYSAFGKVIKGMEVVDKIQIGDEMKKVYVVQE